MQYLNIDSSQQLSLSQTSLPQPTESQCLVKVHAIGVNRADILQKQGKYPPPKGESPILGLEVCGEIIDPAKNNSKWKVGDKVYGLVSGGGYSELVAVESAHLLPLPESMSFVQGAGIAEVFLTAYQSLFLIAKLTRNEKVLIHAGASGVGSAAIQLAKSVGAYVVVTAGSEQKLQACMRLGADQAINYHHQDFAEWQQANLKQGFDVILDVVAGEYLNNNIKVAALDSRIVILSMLGGRFSNPVDLGKCLSKRINIHASTLRNRSRQYKANLVAKFNADFGSKLERGDIAPVIAQEFDWKKANTAHEIMENNLNIGKLILKVT